MFTIYSAPNCVLVFFSGILIDSFGVRAASLLFNGAILLGMIVVAATPFSAQVGNRAPYALLLLGRLLLGLGGESIVAASSTMITKWFGSGGYLNFALAVNTAVVQAGSFASFYILPELSLPAAQLLSVGVAVLSVAANIAFNMSDKKFEAYFAAQCKQPVTRDLSQDLTELSSSGDQPPSYQALSLGINANLPVKLPDQDSSLGLNSGFISSRLLDFVHSYRLAESNIVHVYVFWKLVS